MTITYLPAKHMSINDFETGFVKKEGFYHPYIKKDSEIIVLEDFFKQQDYTDLCYSLIKINNKEWPIKELIKKQGDELLNGLEAIIDDNLKPNNVINDLLYFLGYTGFNYINMQTPSFYQFIDLDRLKSNIHKVYDYILTNLDEFDFPFFIIYGLKLDTNTEPSFEELNLQQIYDELLNKGLYYNINELYDYSKIIPSFNEENNQLILINY